MLASTAVLVASAQMGGTADAAPKGGVGTKPSVEFGTPAIISALLARFLLVKALGGIAGLFGFAERNLSTMTVKPPRNAFRGYDIQLTRFRPPALPSEVREEAEAEAASAARFGGDEGPGQDPSAPVTGAPQVRPGGAPRPGTGVDVLEA